MTDLLTVPPPRPLPPGMTARGATLDDVDVALAVTQAAEQLDHGAPMTVRADIAGDWHRPSMDLATDVVLVEIGGSVVAYAEEFRGRAFAHVHPDVRGHGVGTALAAWTEAHARAAGLGQVGQTIASTATAALALLQGRGYAPRWDAWILRRRLDAPLPDPALPADVGLRTVRRPDEDRALYELIDTAFSDWNDRDTAMAFEDWRASYLDRDGVDPSLVLVLVDDTGRLVGASLCLVEEGEGWIDQLAVARSHRGRGLGGALLQASFRQFRDRGLEVAALSTDSRTGAKTLYEHVGMRVTETFTRLTLSL